MHVHLPDQVIRNIGVGEYHLGEVIVHFGDLRVVTSGEGDCDAAIAAFEDAKNRHAGAMRPVIAESGRAPRCACGHVPGGHYASGRCSACDCRCTGPHGMLAVDARITDLALPDEDPDDEARAIADDAELGHIAIEGTL